jgi:hypothetical protein
VLVLSWIGSEAEQRAYSVLYSTEQIINWRTERVNGRNVLSLVVLREVVKSATDGFQVSICAAKNIPPVKWRKLRPLVA